MGTDADTEPATDDDTDTDIDMDTAESIDTDGASGTADASSRERPGGALEAARGAALAVPPLWPLASSVAVNPYLGQVHEGLALTGARLARVAGAPVTMPRAWYAARIASGRITDADLAAALEDASGPGAPGLGALDVDALKAAAREPHPTPAPVPTVADLAARSSGTDWPALIAERFGAWAASHFDEGQALWAAPRARGTWAEWRSFAAHDLTPEIAGLSGFAAHAVDVPDRFEALLERAVERLGLPDAALETYFHRLLVTLGGWAQYARCLQWRAELEGGADTTVPELLAIRLVWEEVLFERHADAIGDAWREARDAHAAPLEPDLEGLVDVVLQGAFERASQRELAGLLAAPTPASAPAADDGPDSGPARPDVQAAFCIDVRSEVFRRALEAADPGIRTLGFAGFFGIAASHRRFASDVPEHRLPVLLNPGLRSRAGGEDDAAADTAARLAERAHRAWGRFKLAAVSSFAFVEAMGPVYASRLVRDALGLGSTSAPREPRPRFDPVPELADRVAAAEGVLRAMTLTGGFARLVLLCGHGASVANNPHASALQCGACGGYSGETNARLLAGLLNEADVREGLAGRGIDVPADTLFVAALHDTTTDAVTLYDRDDPSPAHADDLARLRDHLAAAGRVARTERAPRLPRAESERDVARRALDWAQTRPEWGLAGCRAFVAAPRAWTAGTDLAGRVFLHDYDAAADAAAGHATLELILTAPVVVASWIGLQYYGSTVAPATFGAGDKLLHNVVGGIGVVEGNGGELRSGLPWQSVHDGREPVHEPQRLAVCVAAPREAMTDILERHDGVRALFDNRWLHLFALDEAGRMAWRYAGELRWEAEPEPSS